ncbi:MAG: hypothetical protein NVS1B10_04310 [Candidatus Saccharimonadales bacterium]
MSKSLELTLNNNDSNSYNRQKAASANRLHNADSAPVEHIGHVLMTGESKIAESNSSPTIPNNRKIETLSRKDLLSLSEKVPIEGTTLRKIYETHLIGESALRRLIAEYFRGGDIKEALRSEIAEREFAFEKDPHLTDSVGLSVSDKSSQQVLKELLDNANQNLSSSYDPTENYQAAAARQDTQKQKYQHNRRLIDIAFAVTITVLVIMVVGLYLTRH